MTDIAQSVSFKDISVQRKLPIINGFVQVPDGQTPREKTSIGSGQGFQLDLRNSLTTADAEAAITGSFTQQISGNIRTDREWYILPEFNPLVGPPEDFFDTLRTAVG